MARLKYKDQTPEVKKSIEEFDLGTIRLTVRRIIEFVNRIDGDFTVWFDNLSEEESHEVWKAIFEIRGDSTHNMLCEVMRFVELMGAAQRWFPSNNQ